MDITTVITTVAPYHAFIIQFSLGLIGSATYFVSAKTGFVKEENPKSYRDTYLGSSITILFFCLIGGLLAVLFGTNPPGSFVEGFSIRPVLRGLIIKRG